MIPHSHTYKIDCNMTDKHNHTISGYTDYLFGVNTLHFHYFFGTTSYKGHTHYYSSTTGMPIKTENGHIHKMDGLLELNNLHQHQYNGYTFEDVAYRCMGTHPLSNWS